jgi:hypothetical protein
VLTEHSELDNWNLCCCVVDINKSSCTLSSDFAKCIPLSFVAPYVIQRDGRSTNQMRNKSV